MRAHMMFGVVAVVAAGLGAGVNMSAQPAATQPVTIRLAATVGA